jgi:hypothetical protein
VLCKILSLIFCSPAKFFQLSICPAVRYYSGTKPTHKILTVVPASIGAKHSAVDFHGNI